MCVFVFCVRGVCKMLDSTAPAHYIRDELFLRIERSFETKKQTNKDIHQTHSVCSQWFLFLVLSFWSNCSKEMYRNCLRVWTPSYFRGININGRCELCIEIELLILIFIDFQRYSIFAGFFLVFAHDDNNVAEFQCFVVLNLVSYNGDQSFCICVYTVNDDPLRSWRQTFYSQLEMAIRMYCYIIHTKIQAVKK